MRDTHYATELRTAEDSSGQRIERLYVKEFAREEIRFSWWKDGKLMIRPLDLPEHELLLLMNDAFEKGVFSSDFVVGLHSALSGHVERARYRAALQQLHASNSGNLLDERQRTGRLVDYLSRSAPMDEDWPEIDDPPPEPVEV